MGVIENLPARERQVFEALYARGEASAAEIQSSMPDPKPSNSAVRVMLGRLEKKGFVQHRQEEQTYIYAPAVSERKVRQTALRQFVHTFFGGSPLGAAAALIGMSESVDPKELEQIQQMLEKARQEQSK
jgi:predicted transcriptional regulator